MARKPSGLVTASKPKLSVTDDTAESSDRRAGRERKKMVAAWVDTACARSLRHLAADEDQTIQELVLHALDLLFREKGMPEIASAKRQGIAA